MDDSSGNRADLITQSKGRARTTQANLKSRAGSGNTQAENLRSNRFGKGTNSFVPLSRPNEFARFSASGTRSEHARNVSAGSFAVVQATANHQCKKKPPPKWRANRLLTSNTNHSWCCCRNCCPFLTSSPLAATSLLRS
jgi:hypothetical protein